MGAKIFIWVGHPRESSLSHGMAYYFEKGACENGAAFNSGNLNWKLLFGIKGFGFVMTIIAFIFAICPPYGEGA